MEIPKNMSVAALARKLEDATDEEPFQGHIELSSAREIYIRETSNEVSIVFTGPYGALENVDYKIAYFVWRAKKGEVLSDTSGSLSVFKALFSFTEKARCHSDPHWTLDSALNAAHWDYSLR